MLLAVGHDMRLIYLLVTGKTVAPKKLPIFPYATLVAPSYGTNKVERMLSFLSSVIAKICKYVENLWRHEQQF